MSYSDNQEKLVISNTGTTPTLYQWQVVSVSSNTVLTASSYPNTYDVIILANANAGNVTITLPQASTVPNRKFTVKRIDGRQLTYNLIIDATSSIIEDQTSVAITRIFSSLTFVSNGTQYYII